MRDLDGMSREEAIHYLKFLSGLAIAVDPAVKVEALKLPPRKTPDEVCCRWAFCVER